MKMKIVRPIWDGRHYPRYHPASEPLTRHTCSGSVLYSMSRPRAGAAYQS